MEMSNSYRRIISYPLFDVAECNQPTTSPPDGFAEYVILSKRDGVTDLTAEVHVFHAESDKEAMDKAIEYIQRHRKK
jgi:hypothetical protein